MVFPSGVDGRVDLNAASSTLDTTPISDPPSPPPTCLSLPLAPCCGTPASLCAVPPCAMPPTPPRPPRKEPLKPPPRPLRASPARVPPAALLFRGPPSSAVPLCSVWPPPVAALPRWLASSSVSPLCNEQTQLANSHPLPCQYIASDRMVQ